MRWWKRDDSNVIDGTRPDERPQPPQQVDILLVEDNPHDIELTMRVFRRHRISNRVHVARDGAEALDYVFCRNAFAQRKPSDVPNMILLDLKLPKVDGMEVLRAIRSDTALRMVPVVVMTSSREDRDVVESYGLGASSYIVKPLDFEQFSTAVQHIGYYWLILNQPPPAPTF